MEVSIARAVGNGNVRTVDPDVRVVEGQYLRVHPNPRCYPRFRARKLPAPPPLHRRRPFFFRRDYRAGIWCSVGGIVSTATTWHVL